MKKIFVSVCFMIMVAGICHAQDAPQDAPQKTGFDKSRLFFGGTFGLAFGSYTTAINVSPQVGYHFSQMFAAGAGINYAYYNYKYYDAYGNTLLQRDIYSYLGLNVFGRLYPIPFAFLQAQPELNYVWGTQKFYYPDAESKIPSQFVPSLLLGAGAAIPTGGRGAITISVLYDVLQNAYSPYYRQAIYAFGFTVGF